MDKYSTNKNGKKRRKNTWKTEVDFFCRFQSTFLSFGFVKSPTFLSVKANIHLLTSHTQIFMRYQVDKWFCCRFILCSTDLSVRTNLFPLVKLCYIYPATLRATRKWQNESQICGKVKPNFFFGFFSLCQIYGFFVILSSFALIDIIAICNMHAN